MLCTLRRKRRVKTDRTVKLQDMTADAEKHQMKKTGEKIKAKRKRRVEEMERKGNNNTKIGQTTG